MRVVLDTNVIASAVFWGGVPLDILRAWARGRLQVIRDLFRKGLMHYWQGRCAVTGIAMPDVLRASHSKPWSECESDVERLDIFNGLLLVANLDALFDRGWIANDHIVSKVTGV